MAIFGWRVTKQPDIMEELKTVQNALGEAEIRLNTERENLTNARHAAEDEARKLSMDLKKVLDNPKINSTEVKKLQHTLDEERKDRVAGQRKAELAADRLREELAEAHKAEKERYERSKATNRATALIHLRKVERYEDMRDRASGARKAELDAIIAVRMEAVKNLGIDIVGVSVDTLIEELSNGG